MVFDAYRININSSYGTSTANENIFGAVAEISLYKEKEELTEYSNLSIELQKAKELNENEYTSASYKELLKVMNEAKDVLYNVNATQEEVDNATGRLIKVMHMLQFYKGDKTALQKLMAQITDLTADDYIESTWNALQAVLPSY